MAVSRHELPVLPDETRGEYFLRQAGRVGEFLGHAQRNPRNLHLFHTVADDVYLNGAVVSPADPTVADALRHDAQALAALAGIETAVGPAYTYRLGGGSTTVPLPPRHKFLDPTLWRRGFHLALISRQPGLLDTLCGPGATAVGKACGLRNGDEELHFVDLAMQVWWEPAFVAHPVLDACEAVAVKYAKKPPPGGLYVRCVTAPYLAALRALAGGDPGAIHAAFADGLTAHREYWSSTDKLRGDVAGYVSLPLTALAALAYDRGIDVAFESDYLPRPWVTGEAFRPA